MSAPTNLKVNPRKMITSKKEPRRLPPAVSATNTKPKARNTPQPVGRKIHPNFHQPTPRVSADVTASSGVATKEYPAVFTAVRKKFFRDHLYTWRKLRRKLYPKICVRHRARRTLKFRIRLGRFRRELISARLKVLTFLRKRPTRLTRVTQAFLRKQFSARAQRVARHTPRPDTKRLGVPALLKRINPSPSRSYLSAFRRTLFRRLLAAVPPQRRARKALYCAINNAAKFVRVVLPAARKRKRHARLGRELRSALFAFRRSRVRLRYSNLHSKYVARVGTNLRRRLVRRLRAKRLCVKTAVKSARTRRVRALAARITCLRRVNSRVKRAAQLLNGINHQVPTPRNVKLWTSKLQITGKRVWCARQRLIKRLPTHSLKTFSYAARRSSEVLAHVRSDLFLQANKRFEQELWAYRKFYSAGVLATKLGLRKLLLASYQLRRRQHSACSVLAPVTYSAAAPRCLAARYTAAFLSRRSRRRRRLTQKSVRTKRLRFAREDAPSMLCARFQPYYHSRVLGSKDDCPSRRRPLRAVDASISLYQTAFADGQQLAEVVTRPFLNRQLLRVPVRKAGHARALFRAYSGARLSRLGLRRAPQLYVDRRTVIVRSRRFVRIRRKTRAGASRLAYFHQRCLRLVRRDTPSGLLKLVSTNKLGRQACLHFTKRWRKFRGTARAAAKRRRDLYSFSLGRIPNWKRKLRRRWYNPRFKGKMRNYRRPAWLVAQNKQSPRLIAVKVPSVTSSLPSLPGASSRFVWLLTKRPPTFLAEPRQKHRKLASASAAVGGTRGSQAVVTPAAHRLLRGVKSTPAAPTKGLASENRSATTRPLASVFYPAAAGGVSKRGVPPLKGGADSQPKKGRRKF